MDLFSDFSFAAAGASNRRSAYLNDFDMEEISPSSSRSTTPVAADIPTSPMSPMAPPVTIDQLSVRLTRHHIDPSAFTSPAPLCVRLQKPVDRRQAISSHPSPDYFDTVRRRRAEGARNLCNGTRLASIETLVDRMLRDGTSCYASLHPSSSAASSRQASRQNSVTSAPTSIPSPNLRSHADDMTSEEDDSDDGPTSPSIVSDPRLAKLRFGSGAGAAAKKSAGIEKASKQKRKIAGKR